MSAFLRETGSELAIVAVNETDAPVVQSFDFFGAEVGELVPYVTNDDVVLEEQPPVEAGFAASYELSPRSVTTFVGSVTVDEATIENPACSTVMPEEESTSTGCSCRQAGQPGAPVGSFLLLALLGGGFALRRARATAFRS